MTLYDLSRINYTLEKELYDIQKNSGLSRFELLSMSYNERQLTIKFINDDIKKKQPGISPETLAGL